MPTYSQSNLLRRHTILQTHKLLGQFLDSYVINALVNLFDKPHISLPYSHTIINYIKEERKHKGLDDSTITISSDITGYDKDKSILCLDIEKNNKKFIHLSIHLTLRNLDPLYNGMIHIVKDIYKISRSKQFYALISVKQQDNKPRSLVFSIADGYTTPCALNASLYDHEVQQEMNVIISVLNKMFDENNMEFYVGSLYKETNRLPTLYPIHDKTNFVLTNMNRHTNIFVRQNKGNMLNPILHNVLPNTFYIPHTKLNSKRSTRKMKKRA